MNGNLLSDKCMFAVLFDLEGVVLHRHSNVIHVYNHCQYCV